jgi:hypothetical protein
VTQLRKKMLEEIQRRNYSHRTASTYVRNCARRCKPKTETSTYLERLKEHFGFTKEKYEQLNNTNLAFIVGRHTD